MSPDEARRLLVRQSALAQDEQDTELMRQCAAQLFVLGRPEDVELIWRAKQSSFDAACSIDLELLCGAGVEPARRQLAHDSRAQTDLLGLGEFDRHAYLLGLLEYYGEDLTL